MKIAPYSAPPPAAQPPARSGADEHTARAALARGIARLKAARVPSAALAAELLLLHVLGRDRTSLYTYPEHPLSAAQQTAFAQLLERRAEGTPVQHLTGCQEFWGLDFEVTPDVLIPRPETEHVVEVALLRLAQRFPSAAAVRDAALRVADVGTGSGCLAVALALELPFAHIVATDISAAALEVARRNAARHAVAARINFHNTNLLDVCLPGPAGAPTGPAILFDLIASNPPYIARTEAATLPREVRDHEPRHALFGGRTGIALYPALFAQAAALLRTGGLLVVELGHDAAPRVRPLLDSPAWTGVAIAGDLAGIPRVLSADRS